MCCGALVVCRGTAAGQYTNNKCEINLKYSSWSTAKIYIHYLGCGTFQTLGIGEVRNTEQVMMSRCFSDQHSGFIHADKCAAASFLSKLFQSWKALFFTVNQQCQLESCDSTRKQPERSDIINEMFVRLIQCDQDLWPQTRGSQDCSGQILSTRQKMQFFTLDLADGHQRLNQTN